MNKKENVLYVLFVALPLVMILLPIGAAAMLVLHCVERAKGK